MIQVQGANMEEIRMKKSSVVILVCVVLIGLFIQGCSGNDNEATKKLNQDVAGQELEESYIIGLAVDQEFDSRLGVISAIKETAEIYGVTIIEAIANGDQQTQNMQIEQFVEDGVDAILVCAVDQIVIEDALQIAENEDIPVIAFDRDIPDIDMVDAYVGPDSYTDGWICGEALLEAFEGVEGTIYVLELVGALNDQNGIDRSAGWNDAVSQNEQIVVIQMPTDWDVDSATEATLTAFQSIPDIQAVFCSTDSFMPSVNEVLTKLEKDTVVGEENHIFINGVNGSEDGYELVSTGRADGFMVMDLDTVGIKTIEIALKVINGEEIERITLVNSTYYDSESAKENSANIWGAN